MTLLPEIGEGYSFDPGGDYERWVHRLRASGAPCRCEMPSRDGRPENDHYCTTCMTPDGEYLREGLGGFDELNFPLYDPVGDLEERGPRNGRAWRRAGDPHWEERHANGLGLTLNQYLDREQRRRQLRWKAQARSPAQRSTVVPTARPVLQHVSRRRLQCPDFKHGLDWDSDDGDVDQEYQRRRDRYDFERGPQRDREVLLPGYTERDLVESYERLDPREARRLRTLVAERAAEHVGRHWYYSDPYCPRCYHHDVAVRRLTRVLIRDSRAVPKDTWDGVIPPMPLAERCSTYLSVSELRRLMPTSMLFDEVLPAGSIGYITGRDGTYKTFLALSLALHILLARAWNGRAYHGDPWGGRVLFIASEGVRTIIKRIDAWAMHHDVELDEEDERNLVVRNGPVNLFAGGPDFQELLAFVTDFHPTVIFIDTLNRSAGAADQNSASDMSVITGNQARLRDAAGDECTVVMIAHTDKGDNDARGSSSIEDDADFVLHCKKQGDDRLRLRVAKMKDGASGQDIDLRALPVAESLVLTTARPEPEWLSSSLRGRITGVLYKTRELDAKTVTQVLALLREDGTGQPAGRTAVYAALGDMKADGDVLAIKTGNSASTPTRYYLNLDRLHDSVPR